MNTTNTSNWNWFDVQAAAGGFITMPDALLMYVSGRNFEGCNITTNGCQHDSTGVASLRRDGRYIGRKKGVIRHIMISCLHIPRYHGISLYV
jgi:hypothetical protein